MSDTFWGGIYEWLLWTFVGVAFLVGGVWIGIKKILGAIDDDDDFNI